MVDNKQSESGFALLVSLIIVSVVISIGLSILDVTIKQVRLTTNSTDSEIAFHAANAGMECARYWRRDKKVEIEGDPAVPTASGQAISDITCFGETVDNYADTSLGGAGGELLHYSFEFDWGGGGSCSEIDMVVALADYSGAGMTVTSATMRGLVPGYPSGEVFDCPASSVCTVVSTKGYNRSCAQKSSYGTVQREVLLEF
jgi:hypothetical protein